MVPNAVTMAYPECKNPCLTKLLPSVNQVSAFSSGWSFKSLLLAQVRLRVSSRECIGVPSSGQCSEVTGLRVVPLDSHIRIFHLQQLRVEYPAVHHLMGPLRTRKVATWWEVKTCAA